MAFIGTRDLKHLIQGQPDGVLGIKFCDTYCDGEGLLIWKANGTETTSITPPPPDQNLQRRPPLDLESQG